jgi:hypothetical protein
VKEDDRTIEHSDYEKRPTNTVWWVLWVIIGLVWLGTWRYDGFDWEQIALGFFTGGVLVAWAIEITGNKVPDSWTRYYRRR